MHSMPGEVDFKVRLDDVCAFWLVRSRVRASDWRCARPAKRNALPWRFKRQAIPSWWSDEGARLIGELASETGVQSSAIRYYEEIGVLAPPARSPSGYRDYDYSASDRV